MGQIAYRQAMLIRRTAWMNLQILDRGPSEADEKYVPAAVKTLALVACMGYAVLDLEYSLAEAGKLRHLVKQRMNHIRRLTEYAHGTAFEMLHSVNPVASRQYNDQLDWMYGRISDCVLLPEPEKSYNIVASLCRLIEKYNGQVSGRYDFAPAKPMYKIPSLLECAGIVDYKLDDIIEMNIK